MTEDYKGLSGSEVSQRVEAGKVNTTTNSISRTKKEIFRAHLCTFFNFLNVFLGALVLMTGQIKNLTFMFTIIANSVIGIIQELKVKSLVDKLSVITASKATVIRDGTKKQIPLDELVVDDVMVLESGDQIGADCVVLEAQGIEVNESMITGESVAVKKHEGDEMLSGSFLVAGSGVARVIHVGSENYATILAAKAKDKKRATSEMQDSIGRIIKIVGFLIVPVGILLFLSQRAIEGTTTSDAIVNTVAGVIGMIPEGLVLLTSVSFILGVGRLARKQALVQEMEAIEALARVNVLCLDKTGTITTGDLEVVEVVPCGTMSDEKIREVMNEITFAFNDVNPTQQALMNYFEKTQKWQTTDLIPFSSATKYSGAVFEDGSYVLGAPEFILRESYEEYSSQIERWSRQGFRVLVFAEYPGTLTGEALTEPASPLGMILVANPIREKAPETFRYFVEQGVEIKVISGDNPVTVSEVAKEAGIANAEAYVDASTLQDYEELYAAAKRYTVFGRVTPDQKRQVVSGLKHMGHTVAMTGDGVNDVLALKDADCSIAMASGSDAASQVAQLVLLESDFSKMPSVVAEGRRVVNNIERTASLFLVKNIFSLLLSIFSIVLLVNYPLEPSQISLISMFTIGIPAFFMSLEPNTDRINGHFLSNVLFKALPGGLTDFLVVSCLYTFCMEFNVNETDVSTSCTVILAIVGLMILFKIASPMNRFHWILWFSMMGGLVYCIIFVRKIFAITSISRQSMMLLLVFAVVTEPTFRYLSSWIKKLSEFYLEQKRRRKYKMNKG